MRHLWSVHSGADSNIALNYLPVPLRVSVIMHTSGYEIHIFNFSSSKLLRQLPHFDDYDSIIAEFATDLAFAYFPANEFVCYRGHFANKLYFIYRGRVELYASDYPLDPSAIPSKESVSGYFGHGALVSETYSATVKCSTSCIFLGIWLYFPFFYLSPSHQFRASYRRVVSKVYFIHFFHSRTRLGCAASNIP